MECQEIRAQLSPYLDEDLALAERWRVDRHVNQCAGCREELAALRRVGAGLQRGDPGRATVVPASFREATLAAARAQLAAARPAAARRRLLAWTLPLAAGVALAAAWWLRPGPSANDRATAPAPGAVPAPAVATAPRPALPPGPPTPLATYAETLARLDARDVLGHFKLAAWCDAHGLAAQAEERYRHVLRLDPDHAATRARLAYVRFRGQWLARAEAEAQGLRKLHGEWVTAEEAERIEKGLRLYEGQWRTPEEILVAKGFVQDEGVWVTPAEREVRVAARRARGAGGPEDPEAADLVVHGFSAGLAPEAMRVLEGVVVGEPVTFACLTVYPLLASRPMRSGVVPIEEATQSGAADVQEGNPVSVDNKGEDPIFVPTGQILGGGYQDRVNLRGVVVGPHRLVQLDVRCCEKQRSNGPSPDFRGLDVLAPLSIRRLLLAGDQGAIWRGIDALLGRAAAQADTCALRSAFSESALTQRLRQGQGALGRLPGAAAGTCLGVVAVLDQRVASVDLFGGANLFDGVYPRLVNSLLVDALTKSGPAAALAAPPSRRYVRSFVERMAFANYRPLPAAVAATDATNPTNAGAASPAAEQELHRIEADFGLQERLEGQALIYGGQAVHISVYAATQE